MTSFSPTDGRASGTVSATLEYERNRSHPAGRWLWILTVILLCGSAITIPHDLLRLWNSDGRDLMCRRREEQYMLKRQNSFDVIEHYLHDKRGEAQRVINRDDRLDPAIGLPVPGGYPPWAFVTNLAFIYTGSLHAAMVYLDVLNLLSIAIAVLWAYRLGRIRYGGARAAFLAASVLAMFSNGSTIRVGQVSLIVNVLLLGLLLADETGRRAVAGLFLALAALKPSVSWLFALRPLFNGQWLTIAVAALILLAESCFVWYMTHAQPLEMVSQMMSQSQEWVRDDRGPLGFLINVGVPQGRATVLLGIGGLCIASLIIFVWRRNSALPTFAVAALIGRFATYHHQYDDVLLVFPLVVLGLLWFEKPTFLTGSGFWLFALTLWAPLRFTDYTAPVEAIIALIWIYALIVLVIRGNNWSRPVDARCTPGLTGSIEHPAAFGV